VPLRVEYVEVRKQKLVRERGRSVSLPVKGASQFVTGRIDVFLWSKNSKSAVFLGLNLQASALLSHLSLSTPIPDTPHHKERHHQGKGNPFLLRLASREALDTTSIRTREKLGGLLKFYSREAA